MVPAIGQTAGRWMTVRYGLALIVIAVCTLIAHIMTERVISQHQDTLEVVNLSGRQRMLSQRAALLVGKIANTPDAEPRAALIPQLIAGAQAREAALTTQRDDLALQLQVLENPQRLRDWAFANGMQRFTDAAKETGKIGGVKAAAPAPAAPRRVEVSVQWK